MMREIRLQSIGLKNNSVHIYDWMSRLDKNIKIDNVSIPGTHDSAAIQESSREKPWACQNLSILGQLSSGIRALDIRLMPKRVNNEIVFFTCHGTGLTGKTFQSFASVMNEIEEFYKVPEAGNETILMSLKIEDWGDLADYKMMVYQALKGYLVNNKRIYRSMNPGNEKLEDLQGRILILNRVGDYNETRYDFGAYLSWADNTKWEQIKTGVGMTLYVQDRWNVRTEGEKFDSIKKAIENTKMPPCHFLKFLSASYFSVIKDVGVKDNVIDYIGNTPKSNRPRPNNLGISPMNFCQELYRTDLYGQITMAQLLIDANFQYEKYPEPFRVLK